MPIRFKIPGGNVETEALLDTGAQINTVGSDTREGAEVSRRSVGRHREICSPLGSCVRCTVGTGNVCLTCSNNKQVCFENDFVVLPNSSETPIVGMKAIREMDLVGENPLLFRTAEALARRTPAMATAGDKVTSRKRSLEAAQGQVKERGGNSPQEGERIPVSDGTGPLARV